MQANSWCKLDKSSQIIRKNLGKDFTEFREGGLIGLCILFHLTVDTLSHNLLSLFSRMFIKCLD
jgi:hypothetical protein